MKVNIVVAIVLGVSVGGVVLLAALGRATEATALGVVNTVVAALLPQLLSKSEVKP